LFCVFSFLFMQYFIAWMFFNFSVHSQTEGLLGWCQVWKLWIKLTERFMFKFLCGYVSLQRGKHQGVWLLDHMVRAWLVLGETDKLSSKVTTHFATKCECSCCSMFILALDVSHCKKCLMISHCKS
jgi:hypothetical protein